MEGNLSPNYTELCLKAKIFHQNLQLNLGQIGQIILALASSVLLIISIRTYKRNKLALHYNFTLLITNIIILRYEKENSCYALFCTVIVWTLTAIINGYMVVLAMQDKAFMEKPVLYIGITTETNSSYLVYMNYFYLAMIVITATVDYFLLRTNRKNKSKDVDYSLSRSYQINENIIVMKLLWPLDVCFAVLFLLNLSGATYLRLAQTNRTLVQYVADFTIIQLIMPIHSIITLLLYLNFVRKNNTRIAAIVESGDHTDIHFQQLKSQWTTI
ncbi:serpentine type 7TM GPCR receptor class ab chemoreceptor domain-containing protein [Ditylenchus destructor]|uniref:Serpentine type 7TM GPCR receptor class ab chemoreceptor domain-containing protein n=1 Tax=Ditylenchus destructor TaxID=166010 RepID=A0AAD4R0A6_9BILA|nr:serpentine type 7TM GPCR receptor class ab chemoreceptor domain-containing protein [Ditylenchus destructor]